jgi:Fe-S-cluster containining protein
LNELLDDLRRIYERADQLYADWSCPNTTECCRFGVTGRQPYITSIELSLVLHSLARQGGELTPQRRALPITRDAEAERVCPLLDRSGRCSVYAERPLGCRTYYCGRAKRGVGPERDDLEELVRELQDLAAKYELGGELTRPLTRALEGT